MMSTWLVTALMAFGGDATHETASAWPPVPVLPTPKANEPSLPPPTVNLRPLSKFQYDVLPKKLPDCPVPVYPSVALHREWQGLVMLRVTLDSSGGVMQVKLHETSGRDVLDRSALEAVAKWRYSPALQAGLPVPSEILVPVRFVIVDPD